MLKNGNILRQLLKYFLDIFSECFLNFGYSRRGTMNVAPFAHVCKSKHSLAQIPFSLNQLHVYSKFPWRRPSFHLPFQYGIKYANICMKISLLQKCIIRNQIIFQLRQFHSILRMRIWKFFILFFLICKFYDIYY